MNFQDPRCSLVEPRYLEFIPAACHSSVSDCSLKASLRVVFKIGLPNIIDKSILLVEITNLVTGKRQNYFISIPDGKCNCEPECYIEKIIKEDFIYITVIFNNLLEGDNHLLQACIDYILSTPTPTITVTPSITPSITPTISVTPTITPTISVTPTITPTISVTPTITPTISVTPTITPTITPTTSSPVSDPYANYGRVSNWLVGSTIGDLTTIGSNGPPSYYGTYDQHGNASEIAITGGNFVEIGGDHADVSLDKNYSLTSGSSAPRRGYRLASKDILSLANTSIGESFVHVGDINNPSDGNDIGYVDHAFYISKGMLTVGQFTKFLNSVFRNSTIVSQVGLSNSPSPGIIRYGSGYGADPYVWIVLPNMFNKPLVSISVGFIARYCNWVLDGEPFKLINNTTDYTYGDAYTVNTNTDIASNLVTGYRLYIPTLFEWYKAAFYDPTLFGGAGGYWDYATRSDTIPATIVANNKGDGPFISNITSQPEDLKESSANYNNGASWGGISGGNTTTVGTNGASSEYGCYDMNGNVREWTDTRAGNNFHILSGAWSTISSYDLSRDAVGFQAITFPYPSYGFRIATLQSSPMYDYSFMHIGDTNENIGYTSRGVVNYDYYLAKYPITNDQYVEFLNAMASISDSNGLFGDILQINPRSGISRSGSVGNYLYSSKQYYGNKPVIGISGIVAMRFCNWLHNGKPSGPQDSTTTEDGAYTISNIIGPNPPSVSRNPGALYFLPSDDEWFKAAYYKRLGDGTYHVYATKSDSTPRAVRAIDDITLLDDSFKGNGLSY